MCLSWIFFRVLGVYFVIYILVRPFRTSFVGIWLREAAKKSSFLYDRAIKRGRGKAGPLRKKTKKNYLGAICKLKIFYLRRHNKISILTMLVKSKSFNMFVAIFCKKYGSLSPKIVERKKLVKIRFLLL